MSLLTGWWPRSHALTVELPPLLADMYAAGFDVTSVSYNLAAWDRSPSRLRVSGHQVLLDGNADQDAASITLVDSTTRSRAVLVVVPPQTAPIVAEKRVDPLGTRRRPARARPDPFRG